MQNNEIAVNAVNAETALESSENESLLSLVDSSQAQNIALIIISTLAVIFVLQWAASFIITLLLGLLLSTILNPLVNRLENFNIHRTIGSTLVICAVVAGVVWSAYGLRHQVQSIISTLPEAAIKLTSGFAVKRGEPLTNLQKVQIAASQVEIAASAAESNIKGSKKPLMRVTIDEPKFKLSDILWRSSLGAFGFVAEAITMIFLAYFILLSGDTFKRKLVKVTGPTLSRKKITVNILTNINISIQRYMIMLLVTNALVGLVSYVAFYALGLDNAGAWAVAAGFLHIVPYFGPIFTAAVTGMAAYMQFDSLIMAFTIAGSSIVIATIIGVFVTTWMTGRIAKMNGAVVFISLIFFSWLWGLWGMLLGIPVVVILKVVCEHIEHLEPIAELLSD